MIVVDAPVQFFVNDKPVRSSALVSTLLGRHGREELLRFGAKIGINQNRLRNKRTVFEHFYLMHSQIERAIDAGAIRADQRRVREIVSTKRILVGLARKPRGWRRPGEIVTLIETL